MKTTKALFAGAMLAASALLWAACTHGAQRSSAGITIDRDDIAGVVTGAGGPEAGVWVVAETSDLPTKFAKIVVTDDQGRYLLPDLPQASYDVWVRGYGLVDSPKQRAEPGTTLNLRATPAPNPRAAAEYYPAGYWYSLLRVPAESEFPGTGAEGNGINANFKSQAEYLRLVKNNSCLGCHQMGSKGTRELHPALGTFENSVQAWAKRLQAGQAGGAMAGSVQQMGPRTLRLFADWTDRIAAGEVPPTPPRPQGIERNVVITMWDWADPKAYLHDLVSTDRRNPTVPLDTSPVISTPKLIAGQLQRTLASRARSLPATPALTPPRRRSTVRIECATGRLSDRKSSRIDDPRRTPGPDMCHCPATDAARLLRPRRACS